MNLIFQEQLKQRKSKISSSKEAQKYVTKIKSIVRTQEKVKDKLQRDKKLKIMSKKSLKVQLMIHLYDRIRMKMSMIMLQSRMLMTMME